MQNDDLIEAKRQRDSFKHRIRLMRDGEMATVMGTPCDIDTTEVSIEEAQRSLAALERKIARLEAQNT